MRKRDEVIKGRLGLRWLFAVWFVWFAAAGCTEEELGGDIAWGPALVLTEAALPEELSAEVFFRVVGLAAVESADHGPVVAVADAGNHRLVFWWLDEGRVEPFGRQGAGPEEFGSISQIWPAGDFFMVSDLGAGRLMFVDPERGEVGTAARDLRNLSGGGAFLEGGLFVMPSDDTVSDPFEFRRLEGAGDRVTLSSADRPLWFPELEALERPVHSVYAGAGLAFPPAGPVSTDVVVSLGEHLVWVEQRTGQVVLLRGSSELAAAPIPDAVIEAHVHEWVESRGESGMREQHFQAFWSTRPDVSGTRALFALPRSEGHPLGWLLEVDNESLVEGRLVRLAEGEAVPYPVRAVLPLPNGQYLVGHEGGITLLEEWSPG